MTNETNVVEANDVAVEEVKPKRTRKPVILKTVTAQEIIAEINELTQAVADLETAITSVDPSNIIYQLAEKELSGKKKELADALDSVYKF